MMTRDVVAFLLLFSATASAELNIESGSCVIENAKTGIEVCVGAFKEVFANRHQDILSNPRKLICCLTNSLDQCLDQATRASRCVDQMNSDLEPMLSSAKSFTSNLFSGVVRLLIGSCYEMEGCDEMTGSAFGAAERQIAAINGSDSPMKITLYLLISSALLNILWLTIK